MGPVAQVHNFGHSGRCYLKKATRYRDLGQGECMDSSDVRVDHCVDHGSFITSLDDCKAKCDGMRTCWAFEYGRAGNRYRCAVYPEGGDNTGVPSNFGCQMGVSDGPVA